jgi:hypothetical protein
MEVPEEAGVGPVRRRDFVPEEPRHSTQGMSALDNATRRGADQQVNVRRAPDRARRLSSL